MSFAPIAIFAYKRLAHLQRLFESLKHCEGFESSQVVVFVDGPKGAGDAQAVQAVRDFASNTGLPNVSVRISDQNKGLRRSVCSGVTAMCAEFGRVIVLEDDLIASPVLLRWFNAALDRYAEDERVYSISAYIYDSPKLRDYPRALVLPLTNSWGWATWQRAWSGFEPYAEIDPALLDSATFRNLFDLNGFYPLTTLLRNAIAKQVDSWFIFWYLHIMRSGGVTIYPPRRYVENHGLRDGATHGSALNPFDLFAYRPPVLERMVELPDSSKTDYWVMDLLKHSRDVTLHRWIARAGQLKRSLKKPPPPKLPAPATH